MDRHNANGAMEHRRSSQRLGKSSPSLPSPATHSPTDDGTKKVEYPRWLPARTSRSNSVVRSRATRKRPHAANVFTCFEANQACEGSVTPCFNCSLFKSERSFKKKLAQAVDQFDDSVNPKRYGCETLWQSTGDRLSKRRKVSSKENLPQSTACSPPTDDDVPSSPTSSQSSPALSQHQASTTLVSPPDAPFSDSPLSKSDFNVTTFMMDMDKFHKVFVQLGVTERELFDLRFKYESLLVDVSSKAVLSADVSSEAIADVSSEAVLPTDDLLNKVDCLKKVIEDKDTSLLAMQKLYENDLSNQAARHGADLSLQASRQENVLIELTSTHKAEIRSLSNSHLDEIRDLSNTHTEHVRCLREEIETIIEGRLEESNEAHAAELTSSYVKIPTEIEDVGKTIEKLIDSATTDKLSRRPPIASRVKVLNKVLLEDVYHGACRDDLYHTFYPLIKKTNPYSKAEDVLRVLDLNGAQINLSSVEVLRKGIEGIDTEERMAYADSWLPSTHYLRVAMDKLEKAAHEVIPFNLTYETDGLDGISFEMEDIFEYIMKLHGLWHIALNPAVPPVGNSLTLDGADMSRNRSFVAAGMKINDPRAIDPKSGIPIGLIGSTKVQSRELCYLMKILMSRNSKTLYDDNFSDFFAFFKRVEEEGFRGIPAGRFVFTSPQDMSSLWKCLKKGGGCKQKTFFCHCCSCRSEEGWVPNPVRCERCMESGRTNCYHRAVGDKETIAKVQEKWQALQASHPYLGDKEVLKSLNTRLAPGEANKEGDPSNIDYNPPTLRKRQVFAQKYIDHDLEKLGLPVTGNLNDKQARLRAVLEHFREMEQLETDISCGDYSGAHIMIEQAIPCILHLENRCGEKMIKMLLIEGIQTCGNNKSQEDALLKHFETVVNRDVLGTECRNANWRLKTTKGIDNKQAIADQTMPNPQVRKMLNAWDKLGPLCLPEGARRRQWNKAVGSWLRLIEVARQQDDFTDEEIDQFDVLCDDFFDKWMVLHGRDGLTNYFHMVGAGHLSYYLRRWRNLYRFSQQGWEGLNSVIKWYYFRRTQQGGHGGKAGEKNSKMKPIARWLQRKLFFISGDYKDVFAS